MIFDDESVLLTMCRSWATAISMATMAAFSTTMTALAAMATALSTVSTTLAPTLATTTLSATLTCYQCVTSWAAGGNRDSCYEGSESHSSDERFLDLHDWIVCVECKKGIVCRRIKNMQESEFLTSWRSSGLTWVVFYTVISIGAAPIQDELPVIANPRDIGIVNWFRQRGMGNIRLTEHTALQCQEIALRGVTGIRVTGALPWEESVGRRHSPLRHNLTTSKANRGFRLTNSQQLCIEFIKWFFQDRWIDGRDTVKWVTSPFKTSYCHVVSFVEIRNASSKLSRETLPSNFESWRRDYVRLILMFSSSNGLE